MKENYGEDYLYNGDFISFVIYLNRKKILSKHTDEIFSDFEFNRIIIYNLEEDIDLGNGLKITNLRIKKE